MSSAPEPAPAASTGSDERGASRALDALRTLLIPGEALESWAVQRRLFALTHRRRLVAATSGRLLSVSRGLFGGFSTEDIRWQDLDDAQLRVGIVGATLTVTAFASTDLASASPGTAHTLVFPGLRKAEAQAVYRTCQAQEQAWREKRRVRDLEELVHAARSTTHSGRGRRSGLRRRRRRRPAAGGAPAARAGDAAAGTDDRRRIRAGEVADPRRSVSRP